MPHSRNIKIGFFDNPELGALPGDARILFIALWTLADREGVIEYNSAVIKRYAFGYRDDITTSDINRYVTVISQLDNSDMLKVINYGAKTYLYLPNFLTHQNPHHTEKKGKLPLAKLLISNMDNSLTVISPLDNEINPADSGFLIPDSGFLKENIYTKEKLADDKKTLEENKNLDMLKSLSADDMTAWILQREMIGSQIKVDVELELEEFKAYYLSQNGEGPSGIKITDWTSRFQGWLLRANKKARYGGSYGGKGSSDAPSDNSKRSKWDIAAERHIASIDY